MNRLERIKQLYAQYDELKASEGSEKTSLKEEINKAESEYLEKEVLPNIMGQFAAAIAPLRCKIDLMGHGEENTSFDYSCCKAGANSILSGKFDGNNIPSPSSYVDQRVENLHKKKSSITPKIKSGKSHDQEIATNELKIVRTHDYGINLIGHTKEIEKELKQLDGELLGDLKGKSDWYFANKTMPNLYDYLISRNFIFDKSVFEKNCNPRKDEQLIEEENRTEEPEISEVKDQKLTVPVVDKRRLTYFTKGSVKIGKIGSYDVALTITRKVKGLEEILENIGAIARNYGDLHFWSLPNSKVQYLIDILRDDNVYVDDCRTEEATEKEKSSSSVTAKPKRARQRITTSTNLVNTRRKLPYRQVIIDRNGQYGFRIIGYVDSLAKELRRLRGTFSRPLNEDPYWIFPNRKREEVEKLLTTNYFKIKEGGISTEPIAVKLNQPKKESSTDAVKKASVDVVRKVTPDSFYDEKILKKFYGYFKYITNNQKDTSIRINKVVLLLAIIQCIQEGTIISSKVTMSHFLISAFNQQWDKYGLGSKYKKNICKGFIHLGSEPFFSINYRKVIDDKDIEWTFEEFNDICYGGYIDEQLLSLVKNSGRRRVLKEVLVNEYLVQ